MILSADGSPYLNHFIQTEHLITLLEKHVFHLVRQDLQSDPNDGKLPQSCFTDPHIGDLERTLGVNKDFLKSQAYAIEQGRLCTYIMCWTYGASVEKRSQHSEGGKRWELITSQKNLKNILGYEYKCGCEFPPKTISFDTLGAVTVQLKDACYTRGKQPVPVVPSYFATAHKDAESYADECEIRIEATLPLEKTVCDNYPAMIQWPVKPLMGVTIKEGSASTQNEIQKINELTQAMSIEQNGN